MLESLKDLEDARHLRIIYLKKFDKAKNSYFLLVRKSYILVCVYLYRGDVMHTSVETTKMSTKGQVTIPKEIRDFTESGAETIFTVFLLNKETIILKKLNKQKIVGEFRALRAKVKSKISEAEVGEIVHKER